MSTKQLSDLRFNKKASIAFPYVVAPDSEVVAYGQTLLSIGNYKAQTWITPPPYMILTIQRGRLPGDLRLLRPLGMLELVLTKPPATLPPRQLHTAGMEAIRKIAQWNLKVITGRKVVLGQLL